ncbi:MAG: hypothetical protein FWE97_04755, partial [Dehalococcoidia bacterium]|nr:hypothetical protein [Dehalococcoidia bacterium]MCL2707450.1 hypothetical protein [Dehalococcoidia bacterium]
KTNLMWLLLAVVAAVAGVIVFLLTERLGASMIMVNWWTIVNAVILILGIVGVWLASKGKTVIGR